MPVIPAVGFAGDVNTSEWARFHSHSEGYRGQVVTSGGDVTPGSGRAVNVSAVNGVLPGILLTGAGGSVSVPLLSTSATQYVVAQANWTANNNAGVVDVKAVASLTQNAGSVWDLPLARVTVPTGSTSVTAAQIEACKPLPRATQTIRGTTVALPTMNYQHPGSAVSGVRLPNKGWPYGFLAVGDLHFRADSGYAQVTVSVDGVGIGLVYSSMLTPSNGEVAVHFTVPAPATGYTESVLVQARVQPAGVSSGDQLALVRPHASSFTVTQFPI